MDDEQKQHIPLHAPEMHVQGADPRILVSAAPGPFPQKYFRKYSCFDTLT